MISIDLPIRAISEANARDHWRKKAKRVQKQREAACYLMRGRFNRLSISLPRLRGSFVVKLTRIGPKELDGDNLQSALKAVRDGVADALRIDDGSDRIHWKYGQEKGKPKEYAVRVDISL